MKSFSSLQERNVEGLEGVEVFLVSSLLALV